MQQATVVNDAVDDGGGHVVITEDCSPPGELQVGGDDQAALFIGFGDDLEQQTCSFGVNR